MAENMTAQPEMAQERIKANRKGKDSVFTHLFSDPEYRFQLFRALHPEMTKVAPEDIIPLTITNVMIDRPYNDLAFLVGKTLLILVEAQAKWSINILIRLLMYLAQTYSDYINDHKLDLYGTKALPLPEPELEFGRTARAVLETIRICKDRNVLKKYLEEREKEVMDIMTLLFDQETAMKNHMAAVSRELTEKITKRVTRNVTREVTRNVTREVEKKTTRSVTLDALKNLMENMKWPATKAMTALGIPSDQQAGYAALLQA